MAASTKKSMSGKKRGLADLSVDEFFDGGFDSSGSEPDSSPKKSKLNKKAQKAKGKANKPTPTHVKQNVQTKSKQTGVNKKGIVSKHKDTLSKLKDQDPEFFEFLKDEDESLLNFGEMSGSDVTDSSDDDDTSKSDDVANVDDDDDDDEEIDFPLSSDEEITPARISKFMEKKNEAEIEELKKKAATNSQQVSKKNEKKAKAKTKAQNKDTAEKVDKKASKQLKETVSKKTKKQTVVEESSDDDDEDDNDVDDDDDGEEFDMDASDDSDEEMLHKPPEELEVMSDSDEEVDEEEELSKSSGKKVQVTAKMVKGWTKRFQEQPSPALVHEAVYAFKAAVQHTATEAVPTKYKVEGAKVYNAVVRMCLVELPGALQKILDLPATNDLQKPVLPSSKTARWKKVRIDVKSYLTDVIKLMTDLSEANMVNVLLKHIHKLVIYYACFQKHTKAVLKKVISIWSSGEETSRVLAFLVINRLIRINQEQHLENCIKQMYMAYVRNCKFTSPNTLPMINFMQRSYIEILALDYTVAYQYGFVYIRQLAIHLRNAITLKKKESLQAVYNWQYVHCLALWSRVLSATYPNDTLQPLLYPLVQTIIGTIKLIPTQRYYPLRFHCVKALTMISKSTRTFIPVLPYLLEVFEQTDFNKKHKSMSLKPFNFATILKLSKVQLQDKAFKDGVIDQLYELLLEQFHAYAHTIGFPELALPAIMQLKEFLKKCKAGNFTKQIKQIVDKVDENSKFITNRRRTININLADTQAVERWEKDCELTVTPLNKFYNTWRKLRDRELMHRIAAKDTVVDVELPTIKRPQQQKATDTEKKEFSALFDTDSENEDTDFTESFLPPDEKKKLMKERKEANKNKQASKKNKTDDDDDDDNDDDDDGDYEDFDSDELEALAGSGDDDDDAEFDDGKDDDDDDDEDDADDNDDDDDDDDDDDFEDKDDIVKEFTMSSDEDD